MKKFFTVFLVLISISSFIYSEENIQNKNVSDESKIFIYMDEGLSFAQVTRLEIMKDRSNFVREDYMAGAFYSLYLSKLLPFDLTASLSAYYPFYHAFNGMKQTPKQVILYSVDFFTGPFFYTDFLKFITLSFTPGIHYMYQLSDEYHLNYLGAGLKAGIEFPLLQKWTILLDGTFNLDNANLGTNQKVQPFDWSWQYHINLGVRFSGKKQNRFPYIK